MRAILTALFSVAMATTSFAAMGASVDWGPTKACFDSSSPPIKLSSVPAGTVKLDIRMMDQNAPDFVHGGGKVDYTGQAELPYGAFRYKGPCPPEVHQYRFTIKALDASGNTIGTAIAKKRFPAK